MNLWSKLFCTFAVSGVLLGCATSGSESGDVGVQSANMKMAATSCMSQVTSGRQECDQKCPRATGSEHFSMQHRLAIENAACTERCAAAMESEAVRCQASR